MDTNIKSSLLGKTVAVLLALIVAGMGVYTLAEKKMIISGKYTGNLYHLGDMESATIAVSFFLVSLSFLLSTFEKKKLNSIGRWMLGTGIVLFLFSAFL